MTNAWLPSLVLLEHHNGSWDPYIEAVYRVFKTDFLDSKPKFRGVRLGLKKHPVVENKECTFWHLISEGSQETNRLPDLRRCERICWPRPMISFETEQELPVWTEKRRNEMRVVIALPDFSYVVVLAKRPTANGPMYLPWTAYCVEHEHRREKLKRKWKEQPF